MSFGLSVGEQIRLFAKTGFDGFFTEWEYGSPIAENKKTGEECGLTYQSLHAPFTKAHIMWTNEKEAEEAVREQIDCLHACAENGIPIMVAHTFKGFTDHSPNEYGIENYGKIVDEAERSIDATGLVI